jgi:general secretion pathway protein G
MEGRKVMKTGFTLVELLIVIIIVAVVAAIAIPKFADSSRRAKESSLSKCLMILRNAGDRCEADTGLTVDVSDLVKSTPPAFGWRRGQMGTSWTSVALNAATWKGPYLEKIPVNPITGTSLYITGGNATADWTHFSAQSFNKSYYYFPSTVEGSNGIQYRRW